MVLCMPIPATTFGSFIILSVIFLAGIYDLKTTEIHDAFPYAIFLFSLLFYLVLQKSLVVMAVKLTCLGLLVGYSLFYAGAWGEGDALLLAAICFSLPLLYPSLTSYFKAYIFVLYLLTLFVVGAIYSIIYSVAFALRKKGLCVFKESAKELLNSKIFLTFSIFGIVLAIFSMYARIFYLLPYIAFIVIFPFLYSFAKYVEKNVFEWYVEIEKLKEGDVLAEDFGIEKFSSKLFVGLTKEDVDEIKKLYKEGKIKTEVKGMVKIREGVRYGFSFFFACLLLYFFSFHHYLIFLPLTMHT